MKRPLLVPLVKRNTGATLVEVLMSLLIMSIGIVSVFSLFPIAILSSIKATQMTNAKLVEENAEELLRLNPVVALGTTTTPTSVKLQAWTSGSTFNATTMVHPPLNSSGWCPIPNRRFVEKAGTTTINGTNYNAAVGNATGTTPPAWDTVYSFNSGAFYGVLDGTAASPVAWMSVPVVIDPLGWWYATATTLQDSYGNDSGSPVPFDEKVHRVHLDASSANTAKEYFTSLDTWTVSYEAIPTAVDNTNFYVTFPSTADLTGSTLGSALASGVPPDARLVFTSPNGIYTATRPIDVSATNTRQSMAGSVNLVTWSGGALPAALDTLGDLGSVRVETWTPRYSWLISIPALRSGNPKPQVAVFFNRQYSTDAEALFDITNVDSTRSEITVDVGTSTPLVSEGNYLFIAATGTWHRIAAIAQSGTVYTITLDSSIPNYVQPNMADRVMFPPGVIKVFELGAG